MALHLSRSKYFVFGLLLLASLALASCGSGAMTSGNNPPPQPSPGNPVSAQKEFLFAATGPKGDIFGFQIDPSSGHLTPLAGFPFPVNTGSSQDQTCTVGCSSTLAAGPSEKFLFDAFLEQSQGVASFLVDANTGALTQSDFHSPPAIMVAPDPKGRFLYGNSGSPAIVAYSIDQGSGALAPTPGMPYPYPAQADVNLPPGVSNDFVYALTRMPPCPPPTVPPTPCNNLQSDMNGWRIDQTTGALTMLPSSPMALGGNLMIGQTMHPSGQFLYSEEQFLDGTVLHYQIVSFRVNADGSLTRLPNPPQQTPDSGVNQLLMSPNGNFLYHTANGKVRAYAIDASSGALTLTGVFDSPGWVAIDPSVKFVYISGTGAITGFTVNPSNGSITPISGSTVSVPEQPTTLAVVKPQ